MWGFKPIFVADRSRRGFTLVEMIISSGLLMLLLTLVLAVYLTSHRVWAKGSNSQEVLGDAGVVAGYLDAELQRSTYDSVSISPDKQALVFLTAKDENGHTSATVDGRPIWNRWMLYYVNGSSLLRSSKLWTAPASDRTNPLKLENLESKPLSEYLDGRGRALTRRLESVSFSSPTDSRLVVYDMVVRADHDDKRKLHLQGAIRPRN